MNLMKVAKQKDGTVDLLADAVLAPIGQFALVGENVTFTAQGKKVSLNPRPPLLGVKTNADLKGNLPEYVRGAQGYTPNGAAVAELRKDTTPATVRVFFGSWCPHCRQHVPLLLRVEDEVKNPKIKFEYNGLPRDFNDPEAQKLRHPLRAHGRRLRQRQGESGRISGEGWNAPEVLLNKILNASRRPRPPRAAGRLLEPSQRLQGIDPAVVPGGVRRLQLAGRRAAGDPQLPQAGSSFQASSPARAAPWSRPCQGSSRPGSRERSAKGWTRTVRSPGDGCISRVGVQHHGAVAQRQRRTARSPGSRPPGAGAGPPPRACRAAGPGGQRRASPELLGQRRGQGRRVLDRPPPYRRRRPRGNPADRRGPRPAPAPPPVRREVDPRSHHREARPRAVADHLAGRPPLQVVQRFAAAIGQHRAHAGEDGRLQLLVPPSQVAAAMAAPSRGSRRARAARKAGAKSGSAEGDLRSTGRRAASAGRSGWTASAGRLEARTVSTGSGRPARTAARAKSAAAGSRRTPPSTASRPARSPRGRGRRAGRAPDRGPASPASPGEGRSPPCPPRRRGGLPWGSPAGSPPPPAGPRPDAQPLRAPARREVAHAGRLLHRAEDRLLGVGEGGGQERRREASGDHYDERAPMRATVSHFEIPARDLERAARFYREVFGWRVEPLPWEGHPYFTIRGAGTGGKEGIDGGLSAPRSRRAPPAAGRPSLRRHAGRMPGADRRGRRPDRPAPCARGRWAPSPASAIRRGT